MWIFQVIKEIYYFITFIKQMSMRLKILVVFVALICLANSFILTNKVLSQDAIITPNSAVFVVFTGIYPDEKLQSTDKIYLRGDNCNMTWSSGSPMKRTSANTWSLMLLCPTNTTIQVKLLLNDKNWMMGANKWFIANDRLTVTIYPSFSPSINKVYDTEAIKSTILGNSRKCSIYLPPSYHDNTFKKYPLLFMHDGQNLFEDSKAAFGTAWKIQDTLNLLIPEGLMDEVIVVGIWNTNNRNNEYTYSYDPEYKFGGKGDQYLDFIQQELEPIVSKKWFVDRIDATDGYLIGGSSLGGLISCYGMYKRSEFFRSAICMSSSFWWNSEDFTNKILTNAYDRRTKVYLDSGDAGDSQDGKNQTLTVKAHMQQIGYQSSGSQPNLFYYLDKGGQHNEYYWGKRFHIPLKAILAPSITTN